MRKLKLYDILKMIDCSDLELPLLATDKCEIACEPPTKFPPCYAIEQITEQPTIEPEVRLPEPPEKEQWR